MNDLTKIPAAILRANVLVVAPTPKVGHLCELVKELGFSNIEQIEDDSFAWTLIFSKRRMKPYHLVLYFLDQDLIIDQVLLRNAQKANLPPGESPEFLLCLESENMELAAQICRPDSFVFNPYDSFPNIQEQVKKSLTAKFPKGVSLINIRDKGNHLIYSFPFEINQGVLDELNERLNDMSKEELEQKVLLFNFKQVKTFDHNSIRSVYLALDSFNSKSTRYASIYLEAHIIRAIKTKAIDQKFQILKTYKGALDKFNIELEDNGQRKTYPRVDVDLINPFIEATLFVFKDLAKIALKPSIPKGAAKENLISDYSTVINFKDNDIEINFSLNFSRETFLNLIQLIQYEQAKLEASEIQQFLHTMLKQIFSAGKENIEERSKAFSDHKLSVLNKKDEIEKIFSDQLNIAVLLTSDIGNIQLAISPKGS